MNRSCSPGAAAGTAGVWLPHTATIRSIKPEIRGVATYELVFDEESVRASYRFRPGQFNMLYLPGIGEAALSLSSSAETHEALQHTVRVVGNVTAALARMRAGEQVALRGPFGSAWPIEECRQRDVVIVAGGIGLAPLRPVLYHVVRHRGEYGRVCLLYGARTPADLLYADEFDLWRKAGVEVEATVDIGDAGWRGHIGVVPVLFQRLRLEADRTRVLTCGPEIMMRFVVYAALERHISPDDVYLSLERNMSCAVGFCGHCQLGPAFVCKDGPVFTYRRMEPYLHVEEF